MCGVAGVTLVGHELSGAPAGLQFRFFTAYATQPSWSRVSCSLSALSRASSTYCKGRHMICVRWSNRRPAWRTCSVLMPHQAARRCVQLAVPLLSRQHSASSRFVECRSHDQPLYRSNGEFTATPSQNATGFECDEGHTRDDDGPLPNPSITADEKLFNEGRSLRVSPGSSHIQLHSVLQRSRLQDVAASSTYWSQSSQPGTTEETFTRKTKK